MSGTANLVRTIAHDSALLKALDLNFTQAASFVGKSRQAVAAKLGGDASCEDYFSMGEIIWLVNASRQHGKRFSREEIDDIAEYVTQTRGDTESDAFKLFLQLLRAGSEPLDVSNAAGIVLVLPNFGELRRDVPEVADILAEMIEDLPKGEGRPHLFVLSSNRTQAAMAAAWLGIDPTENCFGHDLADHYGPTVVVYRRGDGTDRDKALPYVLTRANSFEAAPRFRHTMIAECVLMMLPAKIGALLRPVN